MGREDFDDEFGECKVKGELISREGVETVTFPREDCGVNQACQFKGKLAVLMNSGKMYLVDVKEDKKWWEFWKK